MLCVTNQIAFSRCAGNKIDFDDVFCTRPCFRSVLWINFSTCIGGLHNSLNSQCRKTGDCKVSHSTVFIRLMHESKANDLACRWL